MKILINKQTKDSDLKTGLQVCYQNIDGVFNNLGLITDIITDKDGIKNYLINTAMGAYMADELKLIDNSEDMQLTGTHSNYDFYKGVNRKGQPYYNIVPTGQPKPQGGYMDAGYICRIKNVPNLF